MAEIDRAILRRWEKRLHRTFEAGERALTFDTGTETPVGLGRLDVLVSDRAVYLTVGRAWRQRTVRLAYSDLTQVNATPDETMLGLQTRQTSPGRWDPYIIRLDHPGQHVASSVLGRLGHGEPPG